jgi:hypothetical protein
VGIALPIPHLAVSPAHAVCAPDATPAVDVTCSGTDTDGYEVPAPGINNLVIEDGALVTDTAGGPFFGVVDGFAGTVATLTNNGSIAATLPVRNGVLLSAITAGDFINTGTITGGAFADGVGIGILLNGGVINSGTITGDGGLIVQNNTTNINNRGTITGATLYGVAVNGSLGTFSNTGVVSGAAGLDVRFDLTTLTNGGTITGTVVEGVLVGGTITSLTNNGSITGNDDAIEALNINGLTNFGLISGDDDGIDVDGGDPNDETSVIGNLVNYGTIHGNDDGIDAGTITSLVNTGTIAGGTTDGINNSGIAAAVITNIVNSGTISAGSPNDLGYAIEERGRPEILFPVFRPAISGGDTHLTLNAGSILIGYVDLGGGMNTLNIGQGRSLNSTFDGDIALSTLPLLGNTNGALVAFLDTPGAPDERQIVAIDQSAFLSFDEALYALVSGIGQATEIRQRALRSDPSLGFASRFAAASDPQPGAFAAFNDASPFDPNRFWVEAFGSFRQDQSDRTGSDFDHLTGGLVAGVDVSIDPTTSFGVMAGFAGATSENEINTQETDAFSFFAGVYGSTEAMGLAWDGSLTIGYTDYEADRVTANNLVAGGLETANADFGGWFINPQVTATRETTNPFAGHIFHGFTAAPTLQQSVSLSYAGLFLNGYTETGTTNPLTLNSRSVHIASARAALTLPFERVEADGAITTLRLTGGVEGRTQFGDDTVSGTLLGQAVSTTLDDDDFGAGAFLDLSGAYETASGVTAYANAEAMIETDASWQFSATAGLRIAF